MRNRRSVQQKESSVPRSRVHEGLRLAEGGIPDAEYDIKERVRLEQEPAPDVVDTFELEDVKVTPNDHSDDATNVKDRGTCGFAHAPSGCTRDRAVRCREAHEGLDPGRGDRET